MPILSLLVFFVIERSVLMVLVLITKVSKKKTKNPATLGFVFIIERNQLNVAHVQLLKKLRNLQISNDPFQEMWPKNSSGTM